MSGIAGFIELDGATAGAGRIQAMLDTMHRRGPDRRTTWTGRTAAFGQALLATTPESLAEVQPWVHPQSGCIVVTDSRLDNRPQLLHALDIDGMPETTGDAALLHAAWQRWGRDCADRLRGDFAFAIWDPRRQHLFCARDPMGVRPLYLHHAPGRRIVFASSADSVLAHGDIDRSLDEGRIADALVGETEGIDATCTFFRCVRRVPPAHIVEWRDGQLQQHKYWHPFQDQPAGMPSSEGAWIEAQRHHLEQAVGARLRSQGRVGSMLSGGLDSSAVVALAGRLQEQRGAPPFPTFSAIDSRDPTCAETAAIRSVLASTRTEGTVVDIGDMHAFAAELLDWWTRLGEPFDGTMVLAAAVFHAASRQGVRAMMDGVPADNLFTISGYERALMRRGHWHAAWQVKRDYLATFHADRHAGWRALLRLPGGILPPPLQELRLRSQQGRYVDALARERMIDPDFAQRVDLAGRYRRYRQNMADHAQLSADGRRQSSLGVAYITAAIERYNRVASHFGIEPRPPFADRDLIAFQSHVPWNLRLRGGQPKWILRQAVRGLLPHDVIWRRGKEHLGRQFSTRLSRYLQPDLPSCLRASRAAPYLDPAKLRLALDAFDGQQASPPGKLMAPMLLGRWLGR